MSPCPASGLRISSARIGQPFRRNGFAASLAACLLASFAGSASAQQLGDALDGALRNNPSIKSDDARQDVAVSRLRGSIDAFMPSVAVVQERILTSKISYSPDIAIPTLSGLDSISRREPNLIGIQASLPLFDGFRRYNNFRSAGVSVEAGKALQIERRQQVFLDAATAYLSMIRDTTVVALRRKQVADTSAISARTKTRLDTRDATQTELDISNSRVLAAQVALEQAMADLKSSRIEFARITGVEATALTRPRIPEHAIPKSVEDLQTVLLQSNPRIRAARLDATAAGYLADAQLADLSPQVNLVALHARQTRISDALDRATDSTVKVQMRIPLYEPGAIPRIGEASAVARQRSWDAVDIQKQGVAAVTTLYLERLSTLSQIERASARVKTMRNAVEGYKIEQTEGYRTVIDSLNAQNELSEAQVAKVMLEFIRDKQTFTIAAALARLGPDEVAAKR